MTSEATPYLVEISNIVARGGLNHEVAAKVACAVYRASGLLEIEPLGVFTTHIVEDQDSEYLEQDIAEAAAAALLALQMVKRD